MFRRKDKEKCQQLFERYYRRHKFHDTLYRDRIQKYFSPGARLLDAGCGRYLKFSKEFGAIGQVIGIDLESDLETSNTCSPFGICGDLNHLPFPAGCFDLVISRSVVEHLENPSQVFREFSRVLRPGGRVILLTPNRYDYVSLIAAATPYGWHRALVSRMFQISEDDVFPTLYRANTVSKIGKELRSAGLREQELQTINHYPAYLMFSPVLFRLGVLYERLTSLEFLRSLRGSILCVFEKQDTPAPEISPGKTQESFGREGTPFRATVNHAVLTCASPNGCPALAAGETRPSTEVR